eukprot:1158937-Pelagomonas_calceolata.AAC.2
MPWRCLRIPAYGGAPVCFKVICAGGVYNAQAQSVIFVIDVGVALWPTHSSSLPHGTATYVRSLQKAPALLAFEATRFLRKLLQTRQHACSMCQVDEGEVDRLLEEQDKMGVLPIVTLPRTLSTDQDVKEQVR